MELIQVYKTDLMKILFALEIAKNRIKEPPENADAVLEAREIAFKAITES